MRDDNASPIVRVPISKGKYFALVDAADADLVLAAGPWRRVGTTGSLPIYYAKGGPYGYMHRLVMAAPKGGIVDHINGDGLDNRRGNLRLATKSQNRIHRVTPRRGSKSGYLGVSQHKNRWRAIAHCQGVRHDLGLFEDPIEAALAYDRAARQLHGDFATLNFPEAV